MRPRLTSMVGGLLIVISALMTVVVYSDYTNLISTSTFDLVSLAIIWSSLCLPELIIGLKLLLSKEVTITAPSENEIPILIAEDMIQTPEDTLIICPHCEFVFTDSVQDFERATCPNCTHLVVPTV